MSRPVRSHLSEENLIFMGVPRNLVNKTIEDFREFGNIKRVKEFIRKYLSDIDSNFQNNKGIFLCGSNGVGKTFIASMIVKEAYRHRYSAKRVTFVEYRDRYTGMWGAKGDEKIALEEELYTYFKGVEFLVLEEIGKEIDSKVCIPILEDLLRYREDKGLVTIICTNLNPSDIKTKYGESCFSLICGNMTPIKIEGEDKRLENFNERGKS